MSGKDPFLLHLQMLEDNIYGMRLNLEVLITTFKLTNLRALKPMDNLCAEMLLDIMESLLPTMYGWEPTDRQSSAHRDSRRNKIRNFRMLLQQKSSQEWTAKLDMAHITQQLDEIHGHIHTLTRHAKKDCGAAKAAWRLRLWTLLKRIASVEEVLLTYPQFTTWSEEQIRHRFIPITERISILDRQI